MAKLPSFSTVLGKATEVIGKAPAFLAKAGQIKDLATGATVRLAVTGLSRAGKTVFITSLIHNLLSASQGSPRMPLLKAVSEKRLLSAKLESIGAQTLPRFPYTTNIAKMSARPPDWPERTTDVSEIELDLRFTPSNTIGKLAGDTGIMRLQLIDYPGEWLLDLPLLTQTYAEWSRTMLRLCRSGIRATIGQEFLAFIAKQNPTKPADEAVANQAHELYRAYLLKARNEHGLNFLQPGRFLCQGLLDDAPYLHFCPLDLPEGSAEPAQGSLAHLMHARFEVYKRQAVAEFYQQHFRHFTRQIVLVDVLRSLLAGPEAFEDTKLAIEALVGSFRYGQRSILMTLLGGASIEKVLFAATKADHVPSIQRDNLAELLRNMAAGSSLEMRGSSASVDAMAIASVLATQEAAQLIDGQRVQVVIGKPVGSAKQIQLFVGSVPIKPPPRESWGTPFLNVPIFEPAGIDASPTDGVPHINLDAALEFLLGDRLR